MTVLTQHENSIKLLRIDLIIFTRFRPLNDPIKAVSFFSGDEGANLSASVFPALSPCSTWKTTSDQWADRFNALQATC